MTTTQVEDDKVGKAARTVGVRLGGPHLVLFGVVTAGLAMLVVGGKVAPWWLLVLPVLAAVLFVSVRGGVLTEWIATRRRYRRRRKAAVEPLPAARSVYVHAGDAGVRWDGFTLVSVIEMAGDLNDFTEVAAGRAFTSTTLPLSLVAEQMPQYGPTLAIDVVGTGRHVPAGGPAISATYGAGVYGKPMLGQKMWWLVLRLDVLEDMDAIRERGPVRAKAEDTLAAATLRIVQRLRERRYRARALDHTEINAMWTELTLDSDPAELTEQWDTMSDGAARFSTSYWAEPEELSSALLDRWWSWQSDHTTIVLRLTRGADDEPRVGACVRYVSSGSVDVPPKAHLTRYTGVQLPALLASLPAGDRSMLEVPSVPLAELDEIEVGLGAAGQLIGLRGETIVTVPLYDQAAQPERRRVEARMDLLRTQRLVLRAIAVGATVEIHSADRAAWDRLVSAVGDPSLVWFGSSAARTSKVAVFDGVPVSSVNTRTVLVRTDYSDADRSADLLLEATGPATLRATTSKGELDLQEVVTREEDRYLTHVVEPVRRRDVAIPAADVAPRERAAQPERVVTPRRQAALPSEAPAWERRLEELRAAQEPVVSEPVPPWERPGAIDSPASERRRGRRRSRHEEQAQAEPQAPAAAPQVAPPVAQQSVAAAGAEVSVAGAERPAAGFADRPEGDGPEQGRPGRRRRGVFGPGGDDLPTESLAPAAGAAPLPQPPAPTAPAPSAPAAPPAPTRGAHALPDDHPAPPAPTAPPAPAAPARPPRPQPDETQPRPVTRAPAGGPLSGRRREAPEAPRRGRRPGADPVVPSDEAAAPRPRPQRAPAPAARPRTRHGLTPGEQQDNPDRQQGGDGA